MVINPNVLAINKSIIRPYVKIIDNFLLFKTLRKKALGSKQKISNKILINLESPPQCEALIDY